MFVLVLGRSKGRLTPVLITKVIGRKVSGGYGGGDIPVPIPNTAVKPTSADGTWGSPPGRVGRRRDFSKSPHQMVGAVRIGYKQKCVASRQTWSPIDVGLSFSKSCLKWKCRDSELGSLKLQFALRGSIPIFD